MSEPNLKKQLDQTSNVDTQEILDKLFGEFNAEPGTEQFLRLSLANVILFNDKMADYGPENMASFGTITPVLRMHEKIMRVSNLFRRKRKTPVNEKILDSYRDISVLANIAVMLDTGKWPGVTSISQLHPTPPKPK